MDKHDSPINLIEFFEGKENLANAFLKLLVQKVKKAKLEGITTKVDDNSITITTSLETLAENFQTNRDRDAVSSKWIKDFLDGDNRIEYIDYHPDIEDFKTEIGPESYNKIRAIASTSKKAAGVDLNDEDALLSFIEENMPDLKRAIQNALVRAVEDAANDEVYKDIVKSVTGAGWKQNKDGSFTAVMTTKQYGIVPYILMAEGSSGFDSLFRESENYGTEAIFDLRLTEPRNGWSGDSEPFVDEALSDVLSEFKPKVTAPKKAKASAPETEEKPKPQKKSTKKTKEEPEELGSVVHAEDATGSLLEKYLKRK